MVFACFFGLICLSINLCYDLDAYFLSVFLSWVVGTSATGCLERLVFKVTC